MLFLEVIFCVIIEDGFFFQLVQIVEPGSGTFVSYTQNRQGTRNISSLPYIKPQKIDTGTGFLQFPPPIKLTATI